MKLNKNSYCHDCGKKIEGENFYCESCLEKNGLNNFSFSAFLITIIQPIAGLFLTFMYRRILNPGIYKSVKYGLIVCLILFILGLIYGFFGGAL